MWTPSNATSATRGTGWNKKPEPLIQTRRPTSKSLRLKILGRSEVGAQQVRVVHLVGRPAVDDLTVIEEYRRVGEG